MATVELRTPVLAGGIQSIYFFNGRLLSAEDLSQEQLANRQGRQRLGKAIGDGVVYGLEVKKNQGLSTTRSPIVTVSEGLAVNREGDALQLNASVDVSLVRTPQAGSGAVNALFDDCQPPQEGPYVVGSGVYLLTIQAVSEKEGRAPVSGLGNLDAACNARYQTAGVRFRLSQLAMTPAELSDSARLRNHLAYRCFGSNEARVTSFFADPFGRLVTEYGLLDDLRATCLLDNEVPLALIYWTFRNGIEFIDMWSVRRRVTSRSANNDWRVLLSDRRVAEAEARFLQFQNHIGEFRLSENNLEEIVATKSFKMLPAAGLLPIGGVGSSRGFRYQRFFEGQTYNQPVFMEGAQLESLLHESFHYPGIDLNSRELIWLYFVRENQQSIDRSTTNPPQSYLAFASGHMPYRGNARFDVNRYQYGNYAQDSI